MIILVEERADVADAYCASLGREGMSAASFTPSDFDCWIRSTSGPDLGAVEAFALGDFDLRESLAKTIKTRTEAPAIALNDSNGLEATLRLLAAGMDDVLRKPVHAREIIARIGAIRRRTVPPARFTDHDGLRVFSDGRDPEFDGEVLALPRRERRMIEQFAGDLNTTLKEHIDRGDPFALVTSPEARAYVRMIVDRLYPSIPVLSHVEISRGVRIAVVGSIS